MLTFPKDTSQFSWTRHIKNKMVFYHLSGAQIMRIFRKPKRREEGIAPETIAAMQRKTHNSQSTTDNKKQRREEEIWIMYRVNSRQTTHNKQQQAGTHSSLSVNKSRVTFISAWRYPGITKPGERPLIPEDVLTELSRY